MFMRIAAANSCAPVDTRVHAVRLRCKRIRAVMRLMPDNPASLAIGEWATDVARELAAARDAHAALACAAGLLQEMPADLPVADGAAAIQQWLTKSLQHEELTAERALTTVADKVDALLPMVSAGRWEDASGQLLKSNLNSRMKQARKSRRTAARTSKNRAFHNWRKNCKTASLQLHLFGDDLDPAQRNSRRQLQQLAQLLGQEHDCTVLRTVLKSAPTAIQSNPQTRLLRKLARRWQKQLRQQAFDVDVPR